MTPRLVRSFIVGAFIMLSAIVSPARADCVENLNGFSATVRVFVNGSWHNESVWIPFPTWGEGEWYKLNDGETSCVTPKKNCDGDSFDYWLIDVTGGWSVQITVDGDPVTVDVDDVEEHWDWYYRADSYTKVSPVDFSMNCHGYAFPEGAGTHPDDGAAGADILLDQGTCYETEYIYNADVSLFANHNHSIRVQGFFPCTNPYNNWEIYTETSEKFRESGVYVQCGYCGDEAYEFSADPLAAHGQSQGIENWTRQ